VQTALPKREAEDSALAMCSQVLFNVRRSGPRVPVKVGSSLRRSCKFLKGLKIRLTMRVAGTMSIPVRPKA